MCPHLVWSHGRAALSFASDPGTVKLFSWNPSLFVDEALSISASIEGVPPSLDPRRFSTVAFSDWRLGRPTFLPKWKAPGIKWRLVINKFATPTNRLHSLVCRAIDTVLDSVPGSHWSDFSSPLQFMDDCLSFNASAVSFFGKHLCGVTVAADMCDCFHHLPASDLFSIWLEIAQTFRPRGISSVSVPRHPGGPGSLGNTDPPGGSAFLLRRSRLFSPTSRRPILLPLAV